MAITSADGRLVKMEVDYSDAVATQLPKSEELARTGRLNDAIEELLVLEKQTRQSGDAISSSKILCGIVKICADVKNYDKMNEMMVVLSKRRSQFKQVGPQSCSVIYRVTSHFHTC